MFMRYLNLIPFFAADGGTGGGDSSALSEDAQDLSDLDGAGEDADKDGDENADTDDNDDAGDGEDSEAESEDEDEETGEDDDKEGEGKDKRKVKKDGEEDDVDEVGRPTYKAIKTKFPDFFKTYPTLKAAFFDYPKFIEIFPSVDDAKVAEVKVAEYDSLEQGLVGKGSSDQLLKTLEENNPKALKKIIGNFSESVKSLEDQDLYTVLATPIIEDLLFHVMNHGTKTQNKNLQLAAKHIANFVWANGGEIPDVSKRGKSREEEPSEKEKENIEKEKRLDRQEFENAFTTIAAPIDKELSNFIGEKLDGLSNFEKKQVIKEVRQEVDKKLGSDPGFQKVLASLWAKAKGDGYSVQSLSRIKKAWLERAKTVAPGVRNRLRQEALDAKDPDKSDSKEGAGKKRSFVGSGSGKGSGGKGVVDPKKINWATTTDMDLLK